MKIDNLQKANIIFQCFLHLVLGIVQVCVYEGMNFFVNDHNSQFFIKLAIWSLIAGVIVCVTGICVAYVSWAFEKRKTAIVIFFQSIGVFLSILLYRIFIKGIADPFRCSPSRWMLTPYMVALLAGIIFAVLYGHLKARNRS